MNEWMNNPAMKNIDPIKLELIQMAASQTAANPAETGPHHDGPDHKRKQKGHQFFRGRDVSDPGNNERWKIQR